LNYRQKSTIGIDTPAGIFKKFLSK